MADKSALRELQARLASRLQTVHTDASVDWLAVRVGEGRYLLPLAQSGEIIAFTSCVAVPYTQPWFLGVTNIRGNLFGVIDLARFLGLPTPQTQTSISADYNLITLNNIFEINCALKVGRLEGLKSSKDFTLLESAQDASQSNYCLRIFVDRAGIEWRELDLRLLSQATEFLQISSSEHE